MFGYVGRISRARVEQGGAGGPFSGSAADKEKPLYENLKCWNYEEKEVTIDSE